MKRLISEDSSIPNVNRQQRGITVGQNNSGDVAPQPNQVKSLIDTDKKDTNYEAPGTPLFPIGAINDIISDLSISISNIFALLNQAKDNPNIKDKQHLNTIIKKTKLVHQAVVEISGDVDNIK
jgi:hypothetical protein